METSNPMTCCMTHIMRVLLCNNGRMQLARKLICVGCICIQLACCMQHQTDFEERKVYVNGDASQARAKS